jgi:hypothetical protein
MGAEVCRMTTPSRDPLVIPLDVDDRQALEAAARERGTSAEELGGRWLRERLAHERERALGRAREQRPRDAGA